MEFSLFNAPNSQDVIQLFTDVFSASEGESEGQSIGRLVSELIATCDSQDLMGFVATEDSCIVGAIFFSRFIVPGGQLAFMLSPVAIATDRHGEGIGQQLIHYGLNHLKSLEVSLVVTYGDPAFYAKTGFQQISEKQVPAPFMLSQPIGWLGQTLDGSAIGEMSGSTQCVSAFNNPDYW